MKTPMPGTTHFQAAHEAGAWLRACLGSAAHLTLDSRQVRRGDGFLAAPGLRVDGRQYIDDAIGRGAAAVLADAVVTDIGHDGDTNASLSTTSAPRLGTMPALASQAGAVASAYYGHPSAALPVLAVTGTNGKTSCANWFADGFARDGASAAAIGTLGVIQYGSQAAPALQADGVALTTPDAVSMQRVLAELVRAGISAVSLEASSIGLHQNRLAGVHVDVALFTNLTRDHLDYHGSFEQYSQAKAGLFACAGLQVAIVNGDDPAAAQMLAATAPGIRTIAYGENPARYGGQAGELVTIDRVDAVGAGMGLSLSGAFGEVRATLNLVGRFNAFNAAAVWVAWCALGMAPAEAAARLSELGSVPGRMQAVNSTAAAQAPLVVVDYAHTPDALRAALAALRDQASERGGQLWCVFGCGGDRDAGKRPEMAAAAEAVADQIVLTSDNPRSESPALILQQVRGGLRDEPSLLEVDRRRAITAAVHLAQPADIVLLAGKGHETYQEINGVRTPFDDRVVAREALAGRKLSGQGGANV